MFLFILLLIYNTCEISEPSCTKKTVLLKHCIRGCRCKSGEHWSYSLPNAMLSSSIQSGQLYNWFIPLTHAISEPDFLSFLICSTSCPLLLNYYQWPVLLGDHLEVQSCRVSNPLTFLFFVNVLTCIRLNTCFNALQVEDPVTWRAESLC